MLREQVGAEAFRFEEVWNLFKPEQGGWLLAGIQQVPVSQASSDLPIFWAISRQTPAKAGVFTESFRHNR
jgi:hypothetical protein